MICPRCIHPYAITILTGFLSVWPLRYLFRLLVVLYLFILAVQSIVPRFYFKRFKYAIRGLYSALERGYIGNAERLWAKQAPAIISDYIIIATGSSGAFS